MSTLLIGGIGTSELIVIAVIILILFGGAKLPGLMRGAGRGIREFKDAMNGDEKTKTGKTEETKEAKTEE